MLIPLVGFRSGDTLGLIVLVHDHERVQEIAGRLQQAASIRVAPSARAHVRFQGKLLNPNSTIAAAGLRPLDRVDVVTEPR